MTRKINKNINVLKMISEYIPESKKRMKQEINKIKKKHSYKVGKQKRHLKAL